MLTTLNAKWFQLLLFSPQNSFEELVVMVPNLIQFRLTAYLKNFKSSVNLLFRTHALSLFKQAD